MGCSLPGSSVHGIFHTRILEWLAISYSRESSQFRDRIHVSCISCFGRQILCHWVTWEAPQRLNHWTTRKVPKLFGGIFKRRQHSVISLGISIIQLQPLSKYSQFCFICIPSTSLLLFWSKSQTSHHFMCKHFGNVVILTYGKFQCFSKSNQIRRQ